MASSSSARRSSSPRNDDGGIEPFPAYTHDPTVSGSQQQQTSSTTTSTTTTTTFGGNRSSEPVTTTSAYRSAAPGVPGISVTTNDPDVVPYSRTQVTVPSQIRRRPIGIRRLPSNTVSRVPQGQSVENNDGTVSRSGSGRLRSNSAPSTKPLPATPQDGGASQVAPQPGLATLHEESVGGTRQAHDNLAVPFDPNTVGGIGRRRSISNAARSVISKLSNEGSTEPPHHEYENEVVDLLDVIDPEVSTLTTLTNVQNSLFVPDLGRWLNRRPTYTLSRAPTRISEKDTPALSPVVTAPAELSEQESRPPPVSQTPTMQRTWSWQRRPQPERSHSISSVMTESHYAVLPHGVSLDDWSEEDKEALDDHVRHMLHSRRSKFKQRMRAFGKYVQKPLGLFVTVYATLITLFGLAWVLFLIGWISIGNRQLYIINVIDNVLVALFAVVGDGLAPFRAVDTYHMSYIAHYHHLTWRLRREQNMPSLPDHNDLPDKVVEKDTDPEAAKTEISMLTPQQQKKLEHHQTKFSNSHSFYKPHETATHHAFPLRLLVAIVVLLDCHSLLQISLGACTWGINYHTRPQALTATILCCSITVNITAGILISVGDRKTRKKDVILRMSRQDLTKQAMKKVEKHKKDRGENLSHHATEENFEIIKEEHEGPTSSKK